MESEFGVSRLSVIPVRAENSHRSAQVTQLLFGDHYEVLETSVEGSWKRIRIHADQYEGWIDQKQHYEISPEYFEYINRADFKITTDLVTSILYNKSPLMILMGSIIPISGSELFRLEEQFAFGGESKSLGQKRDKEFLMVIAHKYLHAPYQWGGKSPFGIDCSGFAQMVFRMCGYSLQRDAHQQARQGRAVDAQADLQAGDLAFFSDAKGAIVHVGIVIEPSRIIHASGRVRIDSLDDQGIFRADTRTYSHHYAFARRVLTVE
jgi:hypothetical protein